MRHAQWMLALVVVGWLVPQQVLAQGVPGTLGFTARLQEGNVPVNGTRDFHVAVFDVAAGGTPNWTEDHPAVPVVDGVVYLELGATNGLDAALFTGAARWLEVSVGGVVLTPRTTLDSVPYAIRAGVAQTADGVGNIAAADLLTDVLAGSPLLAQKNGNAVMLSLDTNGFQARVTGSCAPGSSVNAIAADGTVTCETDDVGTGTVTLVDTSRGLLGGPITGVGTLSVDTSVVQTRVTGTCVSGAAVLAVNEDGSVVCGNEVDPRVGTLNANQWCTANATGTAVNCAQPPPARANQTCAAGTSVRGFDANGNVLCTQDVRFVARRFTNYTWPNVGTEDFIPLDQELVDTANAFNPANSTFVAPESGLYSFHAYGLVEGAALGSLVYMLIRAGGNTFYANGGNTTNTSWVQMTAAVTVYLNAGQTASLMGYMGGNPPGHFVGGPSATYMFTAFTGALIH